jgi:hypothetical protein
MRVEFVDNQELRGEDNKDETTFWVLSE